MRVSKRVVVFALVSELGREEGGVTVVARRVRAGVPALEFREKGNIWGIVGGNERD